MSLNGLIALDDRLLIIGIVTGFATLFGGVIAIRLKSKLSALAAVGAGAVISIALVDLLPEALELGRNLYPTHELLLLTLVGFVLYMLIDRLKGSAKDSALARVIGPASLVLHSLMDGLGIGVAFGVSVSVGLTIAAAVLAHDILDGSNTVTLSFGGNPNILRAWGWLLLDAVAPLAGILLSRLISPPATALPLVLALFAGFFLFIGAGELLPRSQTQETGPLNPMLTALGAAFVVSLALLGPP